MHTISITGKLKVLSYAVTSSSLIWIKYKRTDRKRLNPLTNHHNSPLGSKIMRSILRYFSATGMMPKRCNI